MSIEGQTNDQAAGLRGQTLSILSLLTDKAKAFDLSPPVFEEYSRQLGEDKYKVLVVGEAKRGKSTFVNALIGRSILPTDVDIATSQVFLVQHSEKEKYRLRYDDESATEISEADLPRYGSQVVADRDGRPQLDRTIRWIEVDVPIQFLPPGVSLLDTPGLGALYAAHSQITHRWVPHADAVIFVLDSGSPIGAQEIEFVRAILNVTSNLFFIQTKIDQHLTAHWRDIQFRSQDILRQEFKNRLRDARVWPISSTDLLEAARTGDDSYRLESGHSELAAALGAYLARVTGWSRSSAALDVAFTYYTTQRRTLLGRKMGTGPESVRRKTELEKFAQQRIQLFEADWGERGKKRAEVVVEIRRQIAIAKQSFTQSLQPGGAISLAQEAQIEKLKTLKEANEFADNLYGQVIAEATSLWVQTCAQVQARCAEALRPFMQEATDSFGSEAEEGSVDLGPALQLQDFESNVWNRVKGAYSNLFPVIGVAGLVGASVPNLVMLSSPLAPVVIAGGLWALARGYRVSVESEMKTARQELKRHLAATMQQVRRYFMEVDLTSGRFSRVEEYFGTLERTLLESVQSITTRKLQEANAEIALLRENLGLNEQQRAAKNQEYDQQIAEWDDTGKSIAAAQAALKALDRELVEAGTPQRKE